VFYFDLEERAVKAGEEFTVHFTAAGPAQGWQFTLDLRGLKVIDLPENELVTSANFGVFEDALTSSVIVPAGSGARTFSVKFRATGSGKLSEMLRISSRITPAEAYSGGGDGYYGYYGYYGHYGHYSHARNDHNDFNDLNNLNDLNDLNDHNDLNNPNDFNDLNDLNPPTPPMDIALRFRSQTGTTIGNAGFELYQNRPNPFQDQTLIGFYLPEPCEATLSIFDETGRLLHTRTSDYGRGYNAVSVGKNLEGAKGVLYYKLDTPMGSAVRKMVLF
jgi:hypothetical protein